MFKIVSVFFAIPKFFLCLILVDNIEWLYVILSASKTSTSFLSSGIFYEFAGSPLTTYPWLTAPNCSELGRDLTTLLLRIRIYFRLNSSSDTNKLLKLQYGDICPNPGLLRQISSIQLLSFITNTRTVIQATTH